MSGQILELILAECLGYAQTNDPNCLTQPHVPPQVRAMQLALQDAKTFPDAVEYVNAHATGTRAGDTSEIKALNEVFQGTSTLVSSTKGATGHLMGAAGVVEAILSIKARQGGAYPPSNFVFEPDTSIDFALLTNPTQSIGTGIFLRNSFAVGGTNVSLVFRNHD